MELKMLFIIGEDGYSTRYGESDEESMTEAQRIAYRSLRGIHKQLQRVAIEHQREQDARHAEEMLRQAAEDVLLEQLKRVIA